MSAHCSFTLVSVWADGPNGLRSLLNVIVIGIENLAFLYIRGFSVRAHSISLHVSYFHPALRVQGCSKARWDIRSLQHALSLPCILPAGCPLIPLKEVTQRARWTHLSSSTRMPELLTLSLRMSSPHCSESYDCIWTSHFVNFHLVPCEFVSISSAHKQCNSSRVVHEWVWVSFWFFFLSVSLESNKNQQETISPNMCKHLMNYFTSLFLFPYSTPK